MPPWDFAFWAKSLLGQLFPVFSNSGKILLVLKANSLFFFFEKLQLQFQKDFIINATGLDLIIIVMGVGKRRE